MDTIDITRTPIKGCLVFYINIGVLPREKATSHLNKMKEHINQEGFLDRMKANGYEVMFIPVRDEQPTCVEFLKF